MVSSACRLKTLAELRRYVHVILCEVEQLVPEAFPMTERILVRGERACGLHFCLHGPRAAKFTAIWETEKNTILFYSAKGERFRKVQLIDFEKAAPDPAKARGPAKRNEKRQAVAK